MRRLSFCRSFFIGEYFHRLQMTILILRGPQDKIVSQFGRIIGSLSVPSSLRSLTEIYCILRHSERSREERRRRHIAEEVFSFSNAHVCKHFGWRSSPTTNHERNFKIAYILLYNAELLLLITSIYYKCQGPLLFSPLTEVCSIIRRWF